MLRSLVYNVSLEFLRNFLFGNVLQIEKELDGGGHFKWKQQENNFFTK